MQEKPVVHCIKVIEIIRKESKAADSYGNAFGSPQILTVKKEEEKEMEGRERQSDSAYREPCPKIKSRKDNHFVQQHVNILKLPLFLAGSLRM